MAVKSTLCSPQKYPFIHLTDEFILTGISVKNQGVAPPSTATRFNHTPFPPPPRARSCPAYTDTSAAGLRRRRPAGCCPPASPRPRRPAPRAATRGRNQSSSWCRPSSGWCSGRLRPGLRRYFLNTTGICFLFIFYTQYFYIRKCKYIHTISFVE